MAMIKKENRNLAAVPASEVATWFSERDIVDASDYVVEYTADENRQVKTATITDPKNGIPLASLVGTAADGATAGTIMDSMLVLAMRDSSDSTLKTAFKARVNGMFGATSDEEGFNKLADGCEDYLAKIQSGEILVPFLLKYGSILPVFQDVGERNTMVAQKLAEPLPGAEQAD